LGVSFLQDKAKKKKDGTFTEPYTNQIYNHVQANPKSKGEVNEKK